MLKKSMADVNLDELRHLKQFESIALKLLDEEGKYYFGAGASGSSIPTGNQEAFQKYRIQPRVLQDVSDANLNCEILNSRAECPIGIAPTGFHFFAHEDAETATALGSTKEVCVYIMSCVSSTSLEDVAQSLKSVSTTSKVWMQMYLFKDRSVTLDLIKRAENSGFSAVVVSVDSPVSGQWKTDLPENFVSRTEDRYLNLPYPCHSLQDDTLTFDDLKWLTQHTKLPVIVKGIMSGEDAAEAVRHGASAIYVSNHGERQIHKVISTIDVLEEITDAVKDCSIDVYFDGGIRHGSDIFIAMAMGAKAIFIGRPIIWGLTIAGEEGVRKVLKILKEELLSTMKLAGVKSVKDIHKSMIRKVC